MIRHFITLTLLLFVYAGFGQGDSIVEVGQQKFIVTMNKTQTFIEYQSDVDAVIKASEIVYYGIDFSKLILTDTDIVGSEDIIKKYFPAWISYFSRKISASDIKTTLSKGKKNFTLVNALDEIQLLYTKRTSAWIKFDKHELTITDIVASIDTFHLNETSGIGFVIVISNFNKPEKSGSSYYTFFDIKSRKILWSSFIDADPGGWGLTEYWGNALVDSYRKFAFKYHSKFKR